VLLFVFQPTVKKQTVARTGFPGSCLSNVCCPTPCVCTCERNTSARCISCWFVFGSKFIQANSLGNSVHLRPEGLRLCRASALWKAAVALRCLCRVRKPRGSSASSCWQRQAGPARGGGLWCSPALRARVDVRVWWCCSAGGVVPLLFLVYHVEPLCAAVSVPDGRRNREINVKACVWLRLFWEGGLHLVTCMSDRSQVSHPPSFPSSFPGDCHTGSPTGRRGPGCGAGESCQAEMGPVPAELRQPGGLR